MALHFPSLHILHHPSRSSTVSFKILDRYILSKYLKTFLLALALIIIIVITFDVSEKLDDFLSHNAPIKAIIFQYYLNFIPGFVNLYSPLFIFISVIFFTSKMAGNTEIIAILGSGISYRRLLKPFLYGSLLVALIVLILGNFVIPYSNRSLIDFESHYIHARRTEYYNNIHFQSKPGTQIYANSYSVEQRYTHELHKDFYDSAGALVERQYCEHANYDTSRGDWECFNYYHRTIDGHHESFEHQSYCHTDFGLTPSDFDNATVHIETMNSLQLYRYILREKMRGSNTVITALIELYQRLLTPLAIIIMTYIAVSVSSRKTRGGIGLHLAIGISLAFTFIVFMRVGTVFATNGNLPPFLAVLLPQLIFAVIAVFLVRTAPK